MSYVTNVILAFSVMEVSSTEDEERYNIYDNMTRINAWLVEQGQAAFGQNVDRLAGGTKHLEVPVYVAAFNYFRLDEFLAFVRTLTWVEPENVQVFVLDQEDDRFTLIEPLRLR